MLETVKNALRIKASAYDDEIKLYIDSAILDLNRMGIFFDENDIPSNVKVAIIVYVKSQFGNYQADYRESMLNTYKNMTVALKCDKDLNHYGL